MLFQSKERRDGAAWFQGLLWAESVVFDKGPNHGIREVSARTFDSNDPFDKGATDYLDTEPFTIMYEREMDEADELLYVDNIEEFDNLIRWAQEMRIGICQYGTWFGTFFGEEKPPGSDGCIAYEQSAIEALRKTRARLYRR